MEGDRKVTCESSKAVIAKQRLIKYKIEYFFFFFFMKKKKGIFKICTNEL